MTSLIFCNLCSLLCTLLASLYWYHKDLHPAHLLHVAIFLSLNPLLVKNLSETSDVPQIVQNLLLVFLDVLISVPIFIGLIYISAIHIHTIPLKFVIYHAFILSALTIGPHSNHSFSRLLFVHPQSSSKAFLSIDNFMLTNIIFVLFFSWFAGFSYRLDDTIHVAHYPVASCLGALLGATITNFFSITSHLFQHYNTVGVY